MYGNLSSFYYDLDAAHGAHREIPFYREYLKKTGGPILEPMCGTGNFLIPYTQEGFEIEGFDASHEMLARLHEKAAVENIPVSARYGRLEELNTINHYKLVFIPNCSINLILDEPSVLQCLRTIYNALTRDGLFVCELLTSQVCAAIDSNTTLKSRMLSDGTMITVETNTIRCDDQYLTSIHHYTLTDSTGILKAEDEAYTLKLYTPATFEAMLANAGFMHLKTTRLYHHGQKPHADDDIIVYECRK